MPGHSAKHASHPHAHSSVTPASQAGEFVKLQTSPVSTSNAAVGSCSRSVVKVDAVVIANGSIALVGRFDAPL